MMKSHARQLVATVAVQHYPKTRVADAREHRGKNHRLRGIEQPRVAFVICKRGHVEVAIGHMKVCLGFRSIDHLVDKSPLVAGGKAIEHHAEGFEPGMSDFFLLPDRLRDAYDAR